jgi:hypothetical protein
MLRMNSPARHDMVTDHAIGLVVEGGLAAVTARALSRSIGLSAPTILGWYGTARRIRLVVAQTFCDRWMQWVQRRRFRDGALALLPATAEEVAWTRVWLALHELGRLDDDVAANLARVAAYETHVLSEAVGDDGAAGALALVDGLRHAVTRKVGRLDTPQAREILSDALARAASAHPAVHQRGAGHPGTADPDPT